MSDSARRRDRHDDRAMVGLGTPWVVRIMQQLEASTWLDRLEGPPTAVANALLASPARRDLLTGRWLGHAVHPLLTDLPLGMWTCVNTLDLFGGVQARPAARLLLSIGLVSAVPTAVTGLAEWGGTEQPARRVGQVHAVANSVGLLLYGYSLLARRRGDHRAGVALALAGSAAVSVGGYLGGHLTAVRKVSSRHPAFER